MKWQLEISRLEDARFLIRVLVGMCACLLLTCFFLAVSVFTRDETWILVPQVNLERLHTVKRSEWSNEYLIDWADGILSSAMNLSPQTVDKRHNDLLKISSSGSLDLKIYLSDEAKRIKKNQMETAFYPKTYKVNQRAKEIQVVGEMLVYLGRDKAPLALKKSFCVSYVKSPSGMILLSGLKEEKNS